MAKILVDFVVTDQDRIKKLYCKLCGQPIAGMSLRPAGSGKQANVFIESFKRFGIYAEVKFKCTDGSFHVTNGCAHCLTRLNDPIIMTKLLLADGIQQGRRDRRRVEKIVAFDNSGAGVI